MRHKPTAAEKKIIRQCAMKAAGRRRVKVEIGQRVNLETGDTHTNLIILGNAEDWSNTDLHQPLDWPAFANGVELTLDGQGEFDFYVYEMDGNEPGDLRCNVQAHYENRCLVRVTTEGAGTIWRGGIEGARG